MISSRLAGALAVLTLLGVPGLTACNQPPGQDPLADKVVIDDDAAFDLTPGSEDGLYFEYASGGHWRVSSGCTTTSTSTSCPWEATIIPEPGTSFSSIDTSGLDADASATQIADGSIKLVTAPSINIDVLTFDAPPGAWIEVDVTNDGHADAPYFHAFSGGGEAHPGNNPIDVYPAAP